MSDMLQAGVAWLKGQLAAHASQTVTYRRGVQNCTLAATFGQKALKVADGQVGVKIVRMDRDFVVAAAALDFGAGPTLPIAGDLVDVTDPTSGQVLRYAVMAPGSQEPVYQPLDPFGAMLRIHAKFKAVL
jgi:hypothetical protein